MSKKVLVVTPSAKFAGLIESQFEGKNCSVFHHSGAQHIVDKLGSMDVDLLITDIEMAEVNGFQLLKAFRAIGKFQKTPALIMVEPSQSAYKCRARVAGASGWMLKPPEEKQVKQLVDKLFAQ
jgi:two-component system chemotaxis response regulator CheY